MSFEWTQVNPERFEYRSLDDQKVCVAEVFKRCGTYYEAVAFKKGQRSSRLLLHRGDSVSKAMDAVTSYFRRQARNHATASGTPSIQRPEVSRQS